MGSAYCPILKQGLYKERRGCLICINVIPVNHQTSIFPPRTIKTNKKMSRSFSFLETLDTVIHRFRHLDSTTSVSSLYFSKLLSHTLRISSRSAHN